MHFFFLLAFHIRNRHLLCFVEFKIIYAYIFIFNATGGADFNLMPERDQGNKNEAVNIKIYRNKH